MFSTVVFDLDGTLLDTVNDIAQAGNYALSLLSYPVYPVENYKKMVGNGIEKLIYRILPECARDSSNLHLAFAIFTEYYEKHASEATLPYPGILSLLETLKQKHIQMAILSNKDDRMVKQITEHYFSDFFDFAWGFRPEFPTKPNPASLFALLGEMGADASHTLYCGDSDVDILTAKNAGLTSCGVSWGFRGEEELAAAGAHYLAADCDELANIILNLP